MSLRSAALAAAALALAAPAAQAKKPKPTADAPSALQQLVWKGVPVYCGGGRLVALTFDDGPGPWTLQLTAALRRVHATATFFVVGNRIPYWPEGARADARVGVLGNHTWSHAHLRKLRPAAVMRELRWTQVEVVETTRQLPAVFRPPYEQASRRIDRIAKTLGMVDVRWNIDSGDAARGATPAAVVRTVLEQVRPGSIVLLHDLHPWSGAAAAAIVRGLRAQRLRPVTVPTLLQLDPPRQLAGGHRCG
jgi:peptidoglycan/xylan/chitin deacetylase (PgdA/CDA1 family)